MPNEAGNAYGLTTLCPIKLGSDGQKSFASLTREYLQALQESRADASSPMAKVPDTYLCRLFVLSNVNYQGKPAALDSLKSPYLVFVAEIHGHRDPYLEGMWDHAEAFIREAWKHCVGFDAVNTRDHFVSYIARCQVETTLYFNGSNDRPLKEQLKALYLKQEFSKFAYASATKTAEELQRDFRQFVARTRPADMNGPTWRPGAASLANVVIDGDGDDS